MAEGKELPANSLRVECGALRKSAWATSVHLGQSAIDVLKKVKSVEKNPSPNWLDPRPFQFFDITTTTGIPITR